MPVYRFGRLNYVPKLKKNMQSNINYLIISSTQMCPTPQTFNLSNTFKIVELKTLCVPVSATQFCLNVSQSCLYK